MMVFPNLLITITYLYFLMAVLLRSEIIIKFCLLSSVITSDLNSVSFAPALHACTRRTVCGVHARTDLMHAHVLQCTMVLHVLARLSGLEYACTCVLRVRHGARVSLAALRLSTGTC